MPWCYCRPPQIKDGLIRLKKGEICQKCGGDIKLTYETARKGVMKIRMANEPHKCMGCKSKIKKGKPYCGMTVGTYPDKRHTWSLCMDCWFHT
jgi:hypothetical protein